MKNLVACVLLTIALAGCHGYKVHPGSVNTFDSVTADTLTGIKATLDAARPQLPVALKPAFSALAVAYDTAIVSYKEWRDLARKNPGTPATQLQADLAAATKALWYYSAAGGK